MVQRLRDFFAGLSSRFCALTGYGPSRSLPHYQPLSAQAQIWSKQLSEEGIVKIETPGLIKAAEHVEQHYFGNSQIKSRLGFDQAYDMSGSRYFIADRLYTDKLSLGVTVSSLISFQDPELAPLFMDPDIANMVNNQLRRQPFYRNHPLLEEIHYRGRRQPRTIIQFQDPGGFKRIVNYTDDFHRDSPNEITFMLLINDLSESDTHMEYVKGSHRHKVVGSAVGPFSEDADALSDDSQIFRCYGKRGDLFIFWRGGIHRRKVLPGRPRRILHVNLNTGENIGKTRESSATWHARSHLAAHHARMFERLVFD